MVEVESVLFDTFFKHPTKHPKMDYREGSCLVAREQKQWSMSFAVLSQF